MTDICFPPPTAEEARAIFGDDFNPDKTLNGAIALAAAGDLAGPAIALMRAIFTCPAAEARLREAMIVRTAVRLNCTYAVHASIRIALNSGLSQTEVEALTADGPVTGIDPEIVLIARMADEIADYATLGEDLLEAGTIVRTNLECFARATEGHAANDDHVINFFHLYFPQQETCSLLLVGYKTLDQVRLPLHIFDLCSIRVSREEHASGLGLELIACDRRT
jgi:hypothetical protein